MDPQNPTCIERIIRRFAERRDVEVPLLSRIRAAMGSFGTELDAWCGLFEQYELEVCDPSGVEFRPPSADLTLSEVFESPGASSLADLVGFFSACSVVVQADAMSYLASWNGSGSGSALGASRVYSFHPDDWGLWFTDGALSARIYRCLQEDREAYRAVRFDAASETAMNAALSAFETRVRSEIWPPHLDPAVLFERSRWLLHALVNVGGDWTREIAAAAPWSSYVSERALIPQRPHLAAYWLWSHFFFQEKEALAETLALTEAAETQNPIVAEARALIRDLGSKKRAKLGHRTSEMVLELRAMLVEEAPDHLLSEAARLRRRSRGALFSAGDEGSAPNENVSTHATEQRALSALREAGRDEPRVEEALLILEHLSVGGASRPDAVPIRGGMPVDVAMEHLATLVARDARFLPVIRARLQRAARVPDTHRHAGWGLLLATAALSDSFEAFEQVLTEVGTQNLGVRRLTELFRAYGRFKEPAATEALARGAQAWLNQLDDWIRTVPDEPVRQLLERDTLRTHELMTALLERAPFTPHNWDMCVRAACTAGELRAKRAIAGLRRAVQLKLGRVEDGTRARIVLALVQIEGRGCAEFLRTRVRAALAALASIECAEEGRAGRDVGAGVGVDDGDGDGDGKGVGVGVDRGVSVDVDLDDERFTTEKDVACWLGGLLSVEPDDAEHKAWVRERFQFFLPILRQRRAPKKDSIRAVLAILEGMRLGDGRAFVDDIRELETLEFKETRSTRGLAEEIRQAARTIRRQSVGS
ncbi:MAG: hypothetical protein H6729_17070 [Deltaproteobacteria bacterium]|nr:hypothetical protein [Deltaproteobacteria bacterium]